MLTQHTKSLYTCFTGFQSVALEQGVVVVIESNCNLNSQLQIDTQISDKLNTLLFKILDFTPQECHIDIKVISVRDEVIDVNLNIYGIDLYRISEILLVSQLDVNLQQSEEKNTSYLIEIPSRVNMHWQEPVNFSPYYVELNKNLRNHFFEKGKGEEISKFNKAHHSFLNKINKLLELHLHNEDYGVAELANSLHISRTHLYRQIKKITNKSTLAYITLFKLELAHQLLKDVNQNLSVTEVCFACGFKDKAHFSRSFKKQFGMTPSAFKKSKM